MTFPATASEPSLAENTAPATAVDWATASLSVSDDVEGKSEGPAKSASAPAAIARTVEDAAIAESSPTVADADSDEVSADLATDRVVPSESITLTEPVLVTELAALTADHPATQAVTAAEALTATQPRQLAQVSEITELTDVSPNDWAYQAMAGLVEEYGCVEGYPDFTYRGDRFMSRYEFAAGLNSCLDAIRFLIADNGLSGEDLATIQRLSEEFATELAELDGRVDALEADVAELRANQFSTVTKLRGSVFAHVNGGFADDDILTERRFAGNAFAGGRDAQGNPIVQTIDDNPAITFSYLSWINFDSSFTGSDKLTLQFVMGDGNAGANLYTSAGLFNTFGTPFTLQTGTPGGSINDVFVRELSYGFPISDKVSLEVGPRVNWYRFFDNNRYTFFLTGANSFNSSGGTQVNAVDRGTGAVMVWDIADWADLRVGWLAENTEFLTTTAVPDPSRGLFGGAHTLTAQVGLQPLDDLNLRLLYTRSRLVPNGAGQIGGAVSEPLYGLADDGFGGALDGATADTFLVNFDWTPLDWLGLFGRYSYGSTNLIDNGDDVGDVDAQSFQFGFGFPDLFKEGALGTVSYVIPFDILDGREFLVAGGGDGGTQQELEVSYRYPLSPNIAIMPSFYWIINANNFDDNGNIYLFNLQTQLFF
ncbi:MAG: iron uptake porin [Leptolyngbya sp. SIOISBB]|nr:iron uptake porin [Leptolyngbya sp. SIOISBB]